MGNWIRIVHSKPRLCLATPLRIKGVPPVKALTSMRVTTGRYVDNGEAFRVIDNWTSRAQAHAELERRWTGSSWFLAKEVPRPSMPHGSNAPPMPGARRDAQAVSGSVLSLRAVQPRSLCGKSFVNTSADVRRVALCEWTRSAFSELRRDSVCCPNTCFEFSSLPHKTFRPKIETQFTIRRSGAVGGSGFRQPTVDSSSGSSGGSVCMHVCRQRKVMRGIVSARTSSHFQNCA